MTGTNCVFNPTSKLIDVSPYVPATPVPFGELPVASTVPGCIASVNNSSVNTWGGTANGSGSFTVLVWSNGSLWTVIGQ